MLARFLTRLLALPLLAVTLHAQADGLPPAVLQALKAAQIPAASVAVVVQPVDAATPLVAHNAAQAMNPASVMKLLTTYAALDLLGPAYTWKTTVWTDTAPVDGVLNGNLHIRGSGDPRFAIEHLWSLLRQVQVRGIRQIAGDVVLDPHNGSGTTTEAAQLLGRQFIGVDVNPEYCRIAEARAMRPNA